ncbi:MFS transporter [Nonomuraea typhae]|uniref:MFS transporter n=1 Tax=Nonomuraea typhae TaxID=2603600 RepID=UPI0012F9E967|nr:MFS transporter [Nonomuraea typhae]
MLALLVLLTGVFVYTTLGSAIVPGLVRFQSDLGASPAASAWLFTGFLLAASIATPVAGRLGDMYGKRRVVTLTFALMTAGALVSGLAPGLPLMIAGQLLLGVGAGIYPLAYALAREVLPARRVGVAIGTIGGVATAGGLIGYLVGGALADAYSHRWLLGAGAAMLVATVAARVVIPGSGPRLGGALDVGGILLFAASVVALLLAVTFAAADGWLSWRVTPLLALAAAGAGAWFRFEARHPRPFVDMALLRRRVVLAPSLIALAVGFSSVVVFVVVPQLVTLPVETGYGFGGTTARAGLYLLPAALAFLVAGPVAGALEQALPQRAVIIGGALVMALSVAALALWHREPWQLMAASAVMGVGYGVAFTAMTSLIVRGVAPGETGVSAGVSTLARTLGETLGSQAGLSILAAHLDPGTGLPGEQGFGLAFVLGSAAAALALLAAFAVPRKTPTWTVSVRPVD